MQIDKNILICYFLGQSSEEEKEAIHQWLESNEGNKKQFIRERIRFDASIVANENDIKTNKPTHFKSFIRSGLKIAASILILLGSIYMYDSYKMEKLSKSFQSIHVPAGNRTSLTLADGTVVWLNANTSLQYPVVFSKASREVILDGQAYFDVIKNEKPFVVKTNKYNVEVLGTTFDIEAYSKDYDFKTALFSGKVKVYNNDPKADTVFLNPGQTAQLVDGTLKISSTTDANTYRWREGLLYIEDKSFDEIMHLFEKYYNVKIITQNKKVKELGYQGKLRIADGIDHALRVLQNDFPFTYKRDEDSNIIYIY